MRINALRPATNPGRYLWRFVWGPISLLIAIVPLMVINFLQFPSLLLLPFSREAFHTYNRTAAFCVWGWWAWSIQYLVGVKVEITGDPIPDGENAIVIANHQTMGDIPIILCLALLHGRVGDAKWMLKDAIKYVPGVGWGCLFLDCLFLKRRWADDEAAIQRTFSNYLRRKAPLWLIVFPEGTRLTPKKLKVSQEHARVRGQKPTQKVLLPRTRGFSASVFGLKEHVTAVYDLTIHYVGKTPTLVELVRGDPDLVQIHVARHEISSLPVGDRPLATWLTEQFYKKDGRLLGHGHKGGALSAEYS